MDRVSAKRIPVYQRARVRSVFRIAGDYLAVNHREIDLLKRQAVVLRLLVSVVTDYYPTRFYSPDEVAYLHSYSLRDVHSDVYTT